MEILKILNINSSLFYQFAVFIITYMILSPLLFKPYLKVFLSRAELTNYSESTASKLVAETKEINLKYDFKAREINDRISEIFSSARVSAQHEFDQILLTKNAEVEAKVKAARAQIEQQVATVRVQMRSSITEFSKLVSERMVSPRAEKGA